MKQGQVDATAVEEVATASHLERNFNPSCCRHSEKFCSITVEKQIGPRLLFIPNTPHFNRRDTIIAIESSFLLLLDRNQDYPAVAIQESYDIFVGRYGYGVDMQVFCP